MKEFELKEQKLTNEINRLNSVIEKAVQSQRELENVVRERDKEILELTDPHGIKGNIYLYFDRNEQHDS